MNLRASSEPSGSTELFAALVFQQRLFCEQDCVPPLCHSTSSTHSNPVTHSALIGCCVSPCHTNHAAAPAAAAAARAPGAQGGPRYPTYETRLQVRSR